MNTGVLLTALAIVSALTTLTVQGIKKILDESGKTYRSNLLAGAVAIALSVACVIGYVLYYGQPFTEQVAVAMIAFAFLSWLCSMTGFDKIKQLIEQLGKG